jgi:hypothetical protein
MIARTFLILATILTISGCSIFGSKPVEIISQPVKIDIIQPTLPREISLQQPTFYVVSEARIANPCKRVMKLDENGNHIVKEDGTHQLTRPRTCALEDRENPDWPEGYTYLDRFLDDMKALNSGDIVFVASTVKDYELMTANFQELRRYIRELGEVIVYYRDVTIDDKPGVAAEVQKK